VAKYLKKLDSLINAEREYIQKLVRRQPVSLFSLFPEDEFESLSSRHLQERGILRFVDRYIRGAGDGWGGCSAERMKELVEALEMMSADELVKFVESQQNEMENVREDLIDMRRIVASTKFKIFSETVCMMKISHHLRRGNHLITYRDSRIVRMIEKRTEEVY